uniref:Variant surface glycoprotein 410 n=1 Tax=Trypanosoma brucei TaxID=5691 RepID=M4TD65_9TRYP|nr:variant surface glycoprotein 410 [Trypanosoma brucei]
MPNVWTKLSFPTKAGTFLLFLLGLLQDRKATADVAEAGNEATFAALCNLLQTAEGDLPKNVKTPPADDGLQEMEAVNMTLAQEKWRKQFYKGDYEQQTWQQAKDAGLEPDTTWQENWVKWQAAAIATKPGSTTAQKIKEAGFAGLADEAKAHAAAALLKGFAKLKHLQNELAQTTNELQGKTNEDLQKKISEALYGDANSKGSFGKDTAVTDGSQTKNACDADGTVNGKQPLAYAMMCVCLEASAKTLKACRKDQALTKQWNDIDNKAKDGFEAVRKLCPAGPKHQITAASIRAAVAAIAGNIHMNGGVGYLGGYKTTGCQGAAGTGMCVKYPNKITDHGNNFGTLTFAKNMLDVAEALEARHQAAAKIDRLTTGIQAELAAMWKQAEESKALQKLTAKLTQPSTEAAPTLNKKKQECEEQKTNATCTAKNCKWTSADKSDGDFCKPKAGSETLAAGKGETPNAEAKKCSEKTKQEECKDGCKWENNACKDSSILANKHFALSVVSAAFAAFLF